MNGSVLPGAAPCVTPNLAKFLARLDRPALEAVAEAAIDRLDNIDSDPDLELNGDELDANYAEDDFIKFGGFGPGCAIADTGMADRDEPDRCGEYGVDQRRLVSRAAAFISVNCMSQAEVDVAAIPDPMKQRRSGRLGLRFEGRRA